MSDPEPPTRCARHEDEVAMYPCSACAEAAEAHDAWAAVPALPEGVTPAQRAAARARTAIAACRICDDTGLLPNGRSCDHDTDSIDRATRGMQAVRDALNTPGRTHA